MSTTTKPAARLIELGQSAWLDLIGRKLIRGGELLRMIREDGIRGVTANPAIFEKAIAESDEYDDQLAALAEGAGAPATPVDVYEKLAVNDVQNACDVLRPLFDESKGGDGFCSLEVSPLLAADTEGTVAEALRFWKLVDRPNLLVKIPATPEGIPAIRRAIAEGVSVNITLIFSVKVHEQVIEAHIAGLEDRLGKGLPITGIHSVASFFVSRVDSLVDKQLEKIGTPEAKALLGKIAVANAKEAYQLFLKTIASERWSPRPSGRRTCSITPPQRVAAPRRTEPAVISAPWSRRSRRTCAPTSRSTTQQCLTRSPRAPTHAASARQSSPRSRYPHACTPAREAAYA